MSRGIGVRIFGACGSLFCVAAAPGGSAQTTVQVSATVVRPARIDVTSAGPDRAILRIETLEPVNVTSSTGTVHRLGDGTLILSRASSGETLFVTLEY